MLHLCLPKSQSLDEPVSTSPSADETRADLDLGKVGQKQSGTQLHGPLSEYAVGPLRSVSGWRI